MITKMQRASVKLLAVCAAGLMAGVGTSQAATFNWTSGFGDCAYGSVVASAGAWSNNTCTTPTVTNSANQAVSSTLDIDVRGAATLSDGNDINGHVYSWGGSGLGVVNTDSAGTEDPNKDGPHAADSLGRVDSIVLRFSMAIDLDSFTIGWNGTDNTTTTDGYTYNDSDIQVYRWNGTSGAPTEFDKKLSNGWELVGTYDDVGKLNNYPTKTPGGTAYVDGSTATSSYWLISALGNNAADCNIDAFKLLSIAGNYSTTTPPHGVPEPGSLALLGFGAIGFLATRRKSVARR